MAFTKEEKEMLDLHFTTIRSKIDSEFTVVNSALKYIKEQVGRTNNRVNELEAKDVEHLLRCPQKEKIDNIEKELLEYKIFKKYPKFFIASMVIVGIVIILTTSHTMGLF